VQVYQHSIVEGARYLSCAQYQQHATALLLCGSGTINKILAALDIGNVPRISGGAITVIAKHYVSDVYVALNILAASVRLPI
jgi:hypothetical protein